MAQRSASLHVRSCCCALCVSRCQDFFLKIPGNLTRDSRGSIGNGNRNSTPILKLVEVRVAGYTCNAAKSAYPNGFSGWQLA